LYGGIVAFTKDSIRWPEEARDCAIAMVRLNLTGNAEMIKKFSKRFYMTEDSVKTKLSAIKNKKYVIAPADSARIEELRRAHPEELEYILSVHLK